MKKRTQSSRSSLERMIQSGVSPAVIVRVPTGRNNKEQGMALVLALVMLALLGMLGSLALSTATTEMRISSNFRTLQGACYAADLAQEYLKTQGDLVSIRVVPGAGNCGHNLNYNILDNVGGRDICFNTASHKTVQAAVGSGSEAEMKNNGGVHDGPPMVAANVIAYGTNNTECATQTMVLWGQ